MSKPKADVLRADPLSFSDHSAVVEDGQAPGPGQMTKREFLAELRSAVERTAIQTLGPTWSLERCEDIPRFFARQLGRTAAQVEALVRRYGGAPHGNARRYIEAVCERLPNALRRWAASSDLTWEPGPSGLPQALEADATFGDEPTRFADPAAWGNGTPLDGEVRAAMEPRLEASLAEVRVHLGGELASLAGASGVDAVAAGRHVGFAPGAYTPGTPVGRNLLAHELAHVVQQGIAPVQPTRPIPVTAGTGAMAFEADADRAAATRTAPSLRSGVAVRGGNKPHKTTRDDIPSGTSYDDDEVHEQEPERYADPHLYPAQIKYVVLQFVAGGGHSKLSKKIWKLVAQLRDDQPISADAWNGIVDLLVAHKEETQARILYTDPIEHYGHQQDNHNVQLCLELISALARKNEPPGGKPLVYADVIPLLFNKKQTFIGDRDEKTNERPAMPLSMIFCPFLDETNYIHDVDALTEHFRKTEQLTNPNYMGKPFSRRDQIRLLRFPKIREIFQFKLDNIRIAKGCPSPPVLQCILDIACGLTGGKMPIHIRGIRFSSTAVKKMDNAHRKYGTSGKTNYMVYDAKRMHLVHQKRDELQDLLNGRYSCDIWILDVKFPIAADTVRTSKTIDGAIKLAMYETDIVEFSGTCHKGIGGSMIEWVVKMMEKDDGKEDRQAYFELRALLDEVDDNPPLLCMPEIMLPLGVKPKIENIEPEPEGDEKPQQQVVVPGIRLSGFSSDFKPGQKPKVVANTDTHFRAKNGGVYRLAEVREKENASWAHAEYVFELVTDEQVVSLGGGNDNLDTSGPTSELPPGNDLLPVLSELLAAGDLAGACRLLDAAKDSEVEFYALTISQFVCKNDLVLALAVAATESGRRDELLRVFEFVATPAQFQQLTKLVRGLPWG